MTQTLAAWQNLAKAAAITATSYETTLPPENTIDDIGAASTAWQTLAGVTTATITYVLDEPGSSVRVIGLFRTNLSPYAQITATITRESVETWTQTLAGPAIGYGQVVFVLTGVEYADSVEIEIIDDQNTKGCLNVPLVFIGDAWLPEWSVTAASTDGWVPETNIQRTRGGQVYQTLLSNARELSFEFAAIDPDEASAAPREMARLSGMGINVLFIADANRNAADRDAIFGRITSMKPFGYLPGETGIRTWAATIVERM